MHGPIKVVDIELSQPLQDILNLDGYVGVQGLLRLHGVPLGYVKIPVFGNECPAWKISEIILKKHAGEVIQGLLGQAMASGRLSNRLDIEALFSHPSSELADSEETLPSVTVAVCTRDRTSNLPLCLDALSRLNYKNLDLLVVDNAPSSPATEELLRTSYPNIRYVCESRPGLDNARNRAIAEARSEVIAFTDDDAVVDQSWVHTLAWAFASSSKVMCVTGLVVPYELETEAQILFEEYGGFGKGFKRKWYQVDPTNPKHVGRNYGGAGKFGTGANMAFRRCIFDKIGGFDPSLDVGTVTNGGGDLEMYFRILKEGYSLIYEPEAIVRHRHRSKYGELKKQITNHGIGLYSHFVRSALVYSDERFSLVVFGIRWFCKWFLGRLAYDLFGPKVWPRELIFAELWGSLIGLRRYQMARRINQQNNSSYNKEHPVESPTSADRKFEMLTKAGDRRPSFGGPEKEVSQGGVAVRTVDLTLPLQPIMNVEGFRSVRIFPLFKTGVLGSIEMLSFGGPISVLRLHDALVEGLGIRLLQLDCDHDESLIWAQTIEVLKLRCAGSAERAWVETGNRRMSQPAVASLPIEIPVSVVVATFDRPADLRNCLQCLARQKSIRDIEIIVIDNNPTSGLTPPVVGEFPRVRLINEPRGGVAYARNAGFLSGKGKIFVVTDDDVTLPEDWIEKLVAPFVRNDVMMVTGLVLPLELETNSQQIFEKYGGLGRGFKRFEADRKWFDSFRWHPVPTWKLGGTANLAFRSSIFADKEIGLLPEELGPGTPTGVGEDTYLFYKTLKCGYTILYEPSAYVWHKHRRDQAALRRQIYNYSKGHVAYHLFTMVRDNDFRVLKYLMVTLPRYQLKKVLKRLLGRSSYPITMTIVEIRGNLAGPLTLWRSSRRVRKLGHSQE